MKRKLGKNALWPNFIKLKRSYPKHKKKYVSFRANDNFSRICTICKEFVVTEWKDGHKEFTEEISNTILNGLYGFVFHCSTRFTFFLTVVTLYLVLTKAEYVPFNNSLWEEQWNTSDSKFPVEDWNLINRGSSQNCLSL